MLNFVFIIFSYCETSHILLADLIATNVEEIMSDRRDNGQLQKEFKNWFTNAIKVYSYSNYKKKILKTIK